MKDLSAFENGNEKGLDEIYKIDMLLHLWNPIEKP